MAWLEGTGGPKPQHNPDPTSNLNLQHPSDTLAHHPTRSSGISHFFEARQNATATPPRALTAEIMPQLRVASRAPSPSSPAPSSPPSPTSPTFSELTPKPETQTLSPTYLTRKEHGDMELVQSYSTLADPEALPSEMSTALGGVPEGLGHELNLDRTTEFEEYTTQAREALRKEVTTASAKDSGVEDENAKEGMAEPVLEATPPRLQAAWVTEAVAACQANKKNLLNKGTVLIILDPTDFTKSCLLDANTLGKTSDVLNKLYEDAQARSAGCVSQQGELTALLVLSSASSASTPELVAEALDATVESVLPPQPDHTARLRLTRSAKAKAESDQGDNSGDDDSEVPKIDWLKAYERFFRMVAGKKHGISKQILEIALPQIQGVVKVAQRYGAIDAVKSTFTDLLLGYVQNHTLYSTIAKWPSHCLNLGLALESRLVYDEAFKHLVGDSAEFKEGKSFPDLPDDVQVLVQRRSRELYALRHDVEDRLMLMTLPGTQKGRSSRLQSSPEYPSQYVSQHDQRTAYDTVNIFRDWITWHIGHLRNEPRDEPEPFYLCDHADGCTHVAGFYQTIAGQDYLDPDEVYDKFDGHYKSARNCVTELEAVRQALERLKDTASGYVEKLSGSTLHLADKSGLRYLTCVTVEREDVPWAVEEESDEDMDGESDGDD